LDSVESIFSKAGQGVLNTVGLDGVRPPPPLVLLVGVGPLYKSEAVIRRTRYLW